MIKSFLYILSFLIISTAAYSQAPQVDFYSYNITNTSDTIRTYNRNGTWWFGGSFGANGNIYFNDLHHPEFPKLENPFNSLINYNSGSGAGYFLGLMVEYLPPEKKWGYGFKLYFPDRRNVIAETELPNSDRDYRFEYSAAYEYISLSPYARYNLPISGLHLFGGFDIDVSISKIARQKHIYKNSDEIKHDISIVHTDMKPRFNISAGVGWDILLTDINDAVRVRLTPYFDVHAGTKVLSDYNSDWNDLVFKAGGQIKFGPNVTSMDTMLFDPYYIKPPKAELELLAERGLEFELKYERIDLPAIALAYIEPRVANIASNINVELPEKKPDNVKVKITNQPEKPTIDIKYNDDKNFSFASNKTTSLSKDLKEYLTAVADFMKKNSTATIRINGHADNQGTRVENLSRSQARSDKAKAYLVKKGISTGRVFSTGRSAFQPIAPNTTASGRKRNRRVEIQIIQ